MICIFVPLPYTNTESIGKIGSQSITKGTVLISSELASTTVTFGVYGAAPVSTP